LSNRFYLAVKKLFESEEKGIPKGATLSRREDILENSG